MPDMKLPAANRIEYCFNRIDASTVTHVKRIPFYGLILVFLFLTGAAGTARAGINEDARFSRLVEQFLPEYWKIKPVDALAVGYFALDSVPFIPDQAYFTSQGKTLRSFAESCLECSI